MPAKSRAEDMKRYRQRRKEAAEKVEFRAVVTQAEKKALQKALEALRKPTL